MDDEDSTDDNINEKWENIKTIIKETKQQLIEKDEGTEPFKNKWYDEECKFTIEEMKKARERWLIKGRMAKEEQEYHDNRKEAHKIIRNKKKTYMKNVIESIEGQKHNNTRKIYQTINQFKKGYQHKFSIIRTPKKGRIGNEYKGKSRNMERIF